MRKIHFLNNESIVITFLFSSILLSLLNGCVSGGWGRRNMTTVSRYFPNDMDTVWESIYIALEGIEIEESDRERGVIVTQWIERWSASKDMGLLLEGRWHERYRLRITLENKEGKKDKTYVSVSTQMEDKPPGGSRAYRWNRITSDGTIEQSFLRKLEDIIRTLQF